MKNRHLESLGAILTDELRADSPLILTSPSDIGVRRNLGRNGSRFAPEAILGNLKKLQNHLSFPAIGMKKVSSQNLEIKNFEKAQIEEIESIKSTLEKNNYNRTIHLGGGHDHIYPLLAALPYNEKQIIILNLDAHCDTRADDHRHSGTPFRNFDELSPRNSHLIQIGVHKYANSASTLKDLKSIKQTHIYKENFSDAELLAQASKVLDQIKISDDAIFVLSLDADGLSAQEMEAVSAPNHNGFGQSLVRNLTKELRSKFGKHQQVFGIYEYNPIFDNLSQKGSRLIASLMYEFLEG